MKKHTQHKINLICILILFFTVTSTGLCATFATEVKKDINNQPLENQTKLLDSNRAIESVNLKWHKKGLGVIEIAVSAIAACDIERDMSAQITLSTNDEKQMDIPLDLTVPASQGTCSTGNLSDWCVGSCPGSFNCKALISNGGFTCGCSVLKIVHSGPIPLNPGDRIIATINTESTTTPETHKTDDLFEAIIVDAQFVSMQPAADPNSMIFRAQMNTTSTPELKEINERSIRIDDSASLSKIEYGAQSVLLEFKLNEHLHLNNKADNNLQLGLTGTTESGVNFVGKINIDPFFTANIGEDKGVCNCSHSGCNCGEDPGVGDACTDDFIGTEHQGDVKCFFGTCYCMTYAPPEPVN